jgi:hypothetical protein
MASTVYEICQLFYALAYWNHRGKASQYLDRSSIALAGDSLRAYLAAVDALEPSVEDAVEAVELFWALAVQLVRFACRPSSFAHALLDMTPTGDTLREPRDNIALDTDNIALGLNIDSFPCHICHQMDEFRNRTRIEPCGVSVPPS